MTISLVTGGAGFIGSHIVDHLIRMGHQIVILDDLSGGSVENLPATLGLSLEKPGDAVHENFSIVESEYVNVLFKHFKPDYVFHLAAYAAEGLSHYIRHYNYEVNVLGSINLINAAVNYGVKRFVYTSSAAVYGDPPHSPAVEDQPLDPVDPYGVAKQAVELDLQCASEQFGLPFTIFRCHNVYGERQNLNDPYRNAVAIFMRQCLKGEPITIYGDGAQTRQFTYIDNVSEPIANCINLPATEDEIFNLGYSHDCSINGLAAWVSMSLKPDAEIVYLPERAEVRHVRLDHNKFERFFGEQTWVEPWDGIDRMARWAKTQTLREPKPFTGIEIEKGLPEHWARMANANNR